MAIKLDKTKMVRNLAANHKLVPHIEKELGKGDFVWQYDYQPKQGDDAWHPSGDCTPSLNELYWKAKDPQPQDFGSALYKTFQVGHFWHQYLQWIVEKKLHFAKPEDIERKGKKRWGEGAFHWATGSGDIAPCTIPESGEYCVDFKTMNGFDFKRQGVPNWCADKYECQINIYMDFFDLEKGLIVDIQKDAPHDMKEFEFVRNQPLIDAIYHKWNIVSQCLDEGVEPPKEEVIELPVSGAVE